MFPPLLTVIFRLLTTIFPLLSSIFPLYSMFQNSKHKHQHSLTCVRKLRNHSSCCCFSRRSAFKEACGVWSWRGGQTKKSGTVTKTFLSCWGKSEPEKNVVTMIVVIHCIYHLNAVQLKIKPYQFEHELRWFDMAGELAKSHWWSSAVGHFPNISHLRLQKVDGQQNQRLMPAPNCTLIASNMSCATCIPVYNHLNYLRKPRSAHHQF